MSPISQQQSEQFPHRKENHAYQNLSVTPQLAEGVSMFSVMKNFFTRSKSITPSTPLPSVKTDLKSYHSESPSVIWFGHSSYLIHCQGINILVDPVLSGYASPFSWYLKASKAAMFTSRRICHQSMSWSSRTITTITWISLQSKRCCLQ